MSAVYKKRYLGIIELIFRPFLIKERQKIFAAVMSAVKLDTVIVGGRKSSKIECSTGKESGGDMGSRLV